MKCEMCKSEIRDDARFCENCGKPVAAASKAPSDRRATEPQTPKQGGQTEDPEEKRDNPQDVEKWRDTLQVVFRDGLLTEKEEKALARRQAALQITDATALAIRREVEERLLRKRVVARVHRSADEPVSLGDHGIFRVQLESVDAEHEHISATCGYVITGLQDPQDQPLGSFAFPDERELIFRFDADRKGEFDAQLRVVLEGGESGPVILRSRAGALKVVVKSDTPEHASHVYNINTERFLGDVGVDKSVSVGTPISLRQDEPKVQGTAESEWRTIVLEFAPDPASADGMSNVESTQPAIVERPASYGSAELIIETQDGRKRVTVVMSAFVTMGRNRTTPTGDCPEERTNGIQLRVEPTSDPEKAEATSRITGYAHLTICCYGDRVVVIDDSTHGTAFNRTVALKRREETEILDRASLVLANVLELECQIYRSIAPAGTQELAFSALPALKSSPEALNGLLVGFDKGGEIDAIRIHRLNNLDGDLEHLVVLRQARIGSGQGDAIYLDPRLGVREHHVRLLVDRRQLWIECLNDENAVRLQGVDGTEHEVRPGTRVGLRFGDTVEIGTVKIMLVAPST